MSRATTANVSGAVCGRDMARLITGHISNSVNINVLIIRGILNSFLFPGVQRIEQSLASIFEYRQYQLEALGPAVIGVGHMVVHIVAGIVGHAMYLGHCLHVGGHAAQAVYVVVVHTDYEVETVEIVVGHGARTMLEQIASPCGVRTHTSVGQLTGMTGVCTGRVHLHTARQAALLQQMEHDALGRRRTTDVAEAYKQYTITTGCIGGDRHCCWGIYDKRVSNTIDTLLSFF